MLPQIFALFPSFQTIPELEWAEAKPLIKKFRAGTAIYQGEEAAHYAVFLIEGVLQIVHMSENGREVVTHHLEAGDVCAMMVLSGLSERDYPGTLISETEVTALFISKNSFLRWVHVYTPIRREIFSNILDGMIRVGDLLTAKISEPLDVRLARIILQMTTERQPILRKTHRELAVELGTAREVISRTMHRLQSRDWIETGRGQVFVKRREELQLFVGD